MEKFYQLEKTDKKADLYIFGSITSYDDYREKDKSAYSIVKELQELDVEQIVVHINSLGGSVSEGLAIYNTLKNCDAKVTTMCDGFACSAASVVFMAGEERIMNEASLLMIHNAWSYAQGNANTFRKQADDLEKITQASVNAYLRRSNLTEEEIKTMMDEETWISASKAKEYGFATKVQEDEETGVRQSVMKSLSDKLLQASVYAAVVEPGTEDEIDLDAITDQIATKVAMKLNKKEECSEKNSWDAFFGNGE